MDNIQFSVIIPMYNSESTIEKTIKSVLNQTRFDLIKEIIIVNDGSIDNSLQVVENFKKKSGNNKIVIIDKANGGVSTARNTAIRAASAKWIALLDSDDAWLPEKIEIQAKLIGNNPNIDFLGNSHDSKKLKIVFREINTLYRANIQDLCIKQFPATSTIVFKKAVFDDIGGYDENQKYAEDGNFCLKVVNKYGYYYSPENVMSFGNGKEEFGTSGLSANLREMYKGNLKNLNELRENKNISNFFYLSMRVFFFMKYVRRILIVKSIKGDKL
ncbi:MAG: glycosyltransferase family 2 protein [Culicoidibacterales bacterium]